MPQSDICRYKFLVIDDHDLLAVENLERQVNPAVKHPEPVLRNDAPWNTDGDVFDSISVVYDESDDLFKMWYRLDTLPDPDDLSYQRSGSYKLAYAFSTDGICWERPELGLVEHCGAPRTNFVTPAMGSFGAAAPIR